jgi:spermidine/putrescine transport system ATP-binding protein
MPLLELRHVTRRFGDFVAVDDVSIAIEAGEFFTLLGPSGCGKTTLLRMIRGFDLPDAGQILLDGQDLAGTPAERRPINTVFQSYALFPHMTVAENVAFALRMADKPAEEIARRVGEELHMVHLSDKAGAYPDELSGGQKQRVALARGLISRPRLLLLDEPLGALDAKLRVEMQLELTMLQKRLGITFVFVTHAQYEALALSDRIAVMNAGRVEQLDSPDRIYRRPKNRFVADFIGKINLYDCRVIESDAADLRLEVAGLGEILAPPRADVAAGTRGAFALRPEHARIVPRSENPSLKNHLFGRVKEFFYVGDVTTYVIDLDSGARFLALLANSAPGRAKFFELGDEVAVEWSDDAGLFLGE